MSRDIETRTTPELLASILDEMKISNERSAEALGYWRSSEERAKEEHIARMDSYKTLAERNAELAKIDVLQLKRLQRDEETHERWAAVAAGKIEESAKRLSEAIDGFDKKRAACNCESKGEVHHGDCASNDPR